MFPTHVRTEGDGPAVVLIHGVGLDNTMWDLVADVLTPHFQVVRYDIVGHGETPPYQGELTFEILAQQLLDVLDAQRIPDAHLVGFSLGALIAQGFALRFPRRVRKLVLLNSAYVRSAEQREGIAARLAQVEGKGATSNVEASIERWFTKDYRDSRPQQIRLVEKRITSNDTAGFLAAYRLFARSDSLFAGQLQEISAPTLVITGENDVGSTPAMSRAIAEQIPRAQLQIFPGVKHMLPVENADKLSQQLIQFLDKD